MIIFLKLFFVQRTAQVAVGGASVRRELLGSEPVTSEDHVSKKTISDLH